MKIAIYYNLAFGGAKRVVMEHAKGLKKRGHLIDLYVLNHEKDAFDPLLFCDNVYEYKLNLKSSIPLVSRFIDDYNTFVSLRKLHKKIAKEIDEHNYDIVLIHPDKLTQAPFLLRFLKTPAVYYCQEPLRIVYEYSMRLKDKVNFFKKTYEGITRSFRKQIDRINVCSASFTIASCYHVRERMIEAYEVYPKVIYCAVDETVFCPAKIKKENQIFFVGSPNVWEDGYDLAVDAVRLIPEKIRPNLHVVSWKKANGKRLTEKELVRIYNESFLTLCTSRLETFGLVPLESMACGTPVIATKVGGHRETIDDGVGGYLVDFDSKEIAEKIINLLENKNLVEEMGEKGREWVEKNWTWEKQMDELERILQKFIANK